MPCRLSPLPPVRVLELFILTLLERDRYALGTTANRRR